MKSHFAASAFFLGVLGVIAAAVAAPRNPATPQQPAKSKVAVTPSSASNESAEGEKRFQINCGRCHTPPENLSPREARAVLRQMRVRAGLSAEDERLILKYLAP
jgi:cytochrome c5